MVPHRGSEGAAGYDLAPICDGVVLANQTLIVDTGLAVEMPTNCYGRISTRSSVFMVGISISCDIDNDYRDDIRLIVVNNTNFPFTLEAGVAIAHLVITPYLTPEIVFVPQLNLTERGLAGFGSTNNNAKYVVNNEKGMIYIKLGE